MTEEGKFENLRWEEDWLNLARDNYDLTEESARSDIRLETSDIREEGILGFNQSWLDLPELRLLSYKMWVIRNDKSTSAKIGPFTPHILVKSRTLDMASDGIQNGHTYIVNNIINTGLISPRFNQYDDP